MDPRWEMARKILVVRLDNLGDVLLATPAIHAIRRALPDARITLHASASGAQIDGLNPDIDDVLVYQAPWMDPDHQRPYNPSREAAAIAEIRRRGFDGAIIFSSYHESPLPSAYQCYLAGIPLRHAASTDGPGSLLTSRHHHPNRTLHEVERGLDLVAGIGIQPAERDLVLRPRPADVADAKAVFQSYSPNSGARIIVHPGSTCPTRTYPIDRFARAADLLVDRFGATIVWTGIESEIADINHARDQMRHPSLNLAGTTTLGQLAAMIGESDLVITNNTGPMHVAAAMKTPVVTAFALTNPPDEWGPWRVPHRLLNKTVPCQICYQRVCPYGHECLLGVSAEDVARASEQLLLETKGSRR